MAAGISIGCARVPNFWESSFAFSIFLSETITGTITFYKIRGNYGANITKPDNCYFRFV